MVSFKILLAYKTDQLLCKIGINYHFNPRGLLSEFCFQLAADCFGQLSVSYQPVISPYYQLSALIDSHGLPFLLKVSQLLSGTPQYLLNICKEAGTSLLHRQTMPTDNKTKLIGLPYKTKCL